MNETKQALEAVVADWRAQAATGGDAHDGPDYDQGVTETLLNCADDLQAAIDALTAGEQA